MFGTPYFTFNMQSGYLSFYQFYHRCPAHLDSNTALMAEVHQGTVVYGSAWEVTGGDIQLSIEKSSGVYEGMVMIRYRDSQNIEAKIQNDLDDI